MRSHGPSVREWAAGSAATTTAGSRRFRRTSRKTGSTASARVAGDRPGASAPAEGSGRSGEGGRPPRPPREKLERGPPPAAAQLSRRSRLTSRKAPGCSCRLDPRLVCRPLMTVLELPATTLSAEMTVSSPKMLASPESAKGAPLPVSDVTVLALRMIFGARSVMMLAPAWGSIPFEVTSARKRSIRSSATTSMRPPSPLPPSVRMLASSTSSVPAFRRTSPAGPAPGGTGRPGLGSRNPRWAVTDESIRLPLRTTRRGA